MTNAALSHPNFVRLPVSASIEKETTPMASRLASRLPLLSLLTALAIFSGTAARGQTSVALSLYGAFGGSTNGNGTAQSPSNSAGGMVELRHISNPLVGYDVTYSYNRDNQAYKAFDYACPVGTSPGAGCPPSPAAVSANAHELSGDWVVSVRASNLRPFALAGVGVLLNEPAGGQSNSTSATKPVFLYGAGLDWGLVPHLGLRLQYRGNLYHAAGLSTVFHSTDKFTQTAEPMIGAYLKF
jgi:opacity protein-like surface antigen